MTIGFIGLGIMGSRMAANLVVQDVDVVVYNRTPAKTEPLRELGATVAEKVQDTAVAEIMFTMLAHPDAITAVALGPDGFLNHMRPGTLWVDCSTVHPNFSRQMAAEAQARQIAFLDAPVAGTKPQAQDAQLVFLVGGEAENVQRAEPYMQKMGQRVVHVGAAGMGTSLKVVVNALLASAMASFAEGLVLGEALGLSQEMLLNVVLGGPVAAPFLASKRSKLETGDYDPQFPLRWMQKDMQMATTAAYDVGVSMPVANATKELYALAVRDGLGEADFAAIYSFLKQTADD